MSQQHRPNPAPHEPTVYEIRIQGHLGAQWTEWFDGMEMAQRSDGTTILTGQVVDQAALHRTLRTIRDLGMPLISLVRIEPTHRSDQGDQP